MEVTPAGTLKVPLLVYVTVVCAASGKYPSNTTIKSNRDPIRPLSGAVATDINLPVQAIAEPFRALRGSGKRMLLTAECKGVRVQGFRLVQK